MKKSVVHSDETQAYIYQQITELEDFLVEQSNVTVLQKNAKKMVKKLKRDGDVDDDFTAEYCYEFILEEGGNKIASYGLADHPFDAIKLAKEKMLKQLIMMQDEVITNAEHINTVNSIISGNNNLH